MFRVRVKKCYSRRRPHNERIPFVPNLLAPPSKSTLDRLRSMNLACAINWTGRRRNHNNPTYVTSNERFTNR